MLEGIDGAVRGRDQPKVGATCAGLTEALVLPVAIEEAKEVALQGVRELADLVEEQRSALGLPHDGA